MAGFSIRSIRRNDPVMRQPFVHKSPIPGLGLSAGITLSMLSLMVLLPIAGLLVQGFSAGVPAFVAAVNTPRTWAALFLSFRLSLVAALFNLGFGVVLAWVLVQKKF